ncbi:MAG: isoprenoid biosynthesis glyoxalase ElbB [Deltaproteobacteria bacterium]|nr:isoprenoid biosynthesis glyoxalase ElbB [Deltaproteobacteria bacterium]
MARAKVGVLLSGCGVYDGAEIHESVVTLLALDRAGAEAICMAPNVNQLHVVNHLSGDVSGEKARNVLTESARIARGKVRDLGTVNPSELDALILPGGYGAAKNLSDYAIKGADCTVHPDVARLIKTMHAAGKPIGALCIAPAVVARVLGAERPRLTIGNDASTAATLEAMGARHQACSVRDIVVDYEARILSTPAYMLAEAIGEAASGIEKLVHEILAMVAKE